ncbi:acetyl-CoA acetyltransferase [Pseudorhodoferax sp. Leaf267]|uniref:acetyl-CoA acetyltransferase n=1 Tax=Pseudorhodoferax sp. Leaf267 TaxID=1736316 RepID=UPI0006FA286D|nr:acetyl-CoA acetyltransferase [Pseudorhodoferax sp. Leaf267]KQP14191.1 hypothetical protein ASF43_15290 [Pseudorhodoferax sp. Leaf267]
MAGTLNPAVPDRTPILVGVGQAVDRLDAPGYRALSPYDLAAQACAEACADALSLQALRAEIDTIASTRTFDASRPVPPPFGISTNHPRSIARRLGMGPQRAILEQVGGDSPQRLVNELCARIAEGEVGVALVTGSEAISTARHMQQQGTLLNWAEQVAGSLDDRGAGSSLPAAQRRQRLVGAPTVYAVLESARRARLGLSRADYAAQMGALFAPFTGVAARNPYACSAQPSRTAEELVTVGPRNRMVADPYPLRLVSRDQVNQGAALLLTSVGNARRLGIARERWVFLHGCSALAERPVLERADLGTSPAARMAVRAALAQAGATVPQIDLFDFYSCFPIAVSNVACDALGLAADDARGLTVTGGLPYFGGPGNSYSLHAIAEMAQRLRARPGALGLVGANGGHLSKYAAGVYSTTPRAWQAPDDAPLQQRIDAEPAPPFAEKVAGPARIEGYTVVHQQGQPTHAIVVGRLLQGGQRVLATTAVGDTATPQAMHDLDPLARRVRVRWQDGLQIFQLDPQGCA